MHRITTVELTPAIVSLFDRTKPTMPRAFNVLEGTVRGEIVVDPGAQPTWAVVRDTVYGTLYLGGQFTATLLATLVHQFRQHGDVGIGCWPDDSLCSLLPPNPDYDGATLLFTNRSPASDHAVRTQLAVPYALAVRDQDTLPQSFDYESTLAAFGTPEQIIRLTHGVVVLANGRVVCEAATGAPTHGRIEVGVTTAAEHRQKGLARMACAALIARCEAAGLATWWDCAKHNVASVRLAQRMGYQDVREYRYVWWRKT